MMAGRTFALNRKARFEYDILETYEAGLVLEGTEIKAIREGRANIADAYARPDGGELWLVNAHIGQYSAGGPVNHDPRQPRKLLLHKDEIARLASQVEAKRLTIVPLRLYLKRHRAKIELGLARGRRQYDKRRAIIERDRDREARQAVRRAM
jgi:SsrA-binding protein